MAFFEVNNLKKQFDEFEINVSFSVEKNSFTSILGQSGSGKSTLLKLISGILPLDEEHEKQRKPREKSPRDNSANTPNSPTTQPPPASIILDNKDITRLPCRERECGMVFQSNSLFLNMTVQDNIAYGLRCNGVPKKQARSEASRLLSLFGLGGFEKRHVHTLSGGEAQRVALARTLIVRPKLILFDEPLSALDAPLRKKLAGDILALQKEFGFTALMVTHDINEAKFMAQKIFLMKKGVFTWQGKSEDFSESQMDLA